MYFLKFSPAALSARHTLCINRFVIPIFYVLKMTGSLGTLKTRPSKTKREKLEEKMH